VVHGPVREVVRGPGPLDWSMDRGSVFSGHPDNKCYDKKQEFGSTMHYICVHCCTGDKCNPASQMKGGIILTAVSATLALMKYLYF